MLKIEDLTPFKAVAILPGPRTSFLDHLIPLCHFWNIPLVCTDYWVYTCAQTFYPPTEVLLAGQGNFQEILSSYRTFVTVEPCRLHPRALQFGEFLYKGEGTTIAGFHGNPAKFREEFWIERYADEDVVLVYGNHLIDYLKEKGVWERLKEKRVMGNMRKRFYETHRPFFDTVVKPHLFSSHGKKVVFWAPTWHYPADFSLFSQILETLTPHFRVVAKLHPYLYRLFPDETRSLKERYRSNEAVLFLEEIPLIYPLIQQADLYLGDDSSVAYDFLSLDRPLFFMGKGDYQWGTKVVHLSELSSFLKKEDTLSSERRRAYAYVFEETA